MCKHSSSWHVTCKGGGGAGPAMRGGDSAQWAACAHHHSSSSPSIWIFISQASGCGPNHSCMGNMHRNQDGCSIGNAVIIPPRDESELIILNDGPEPVTTHYLQFCPLVDINYWEYIVFLKNNVARMLDPCHATQQYGPRHARMRWGGCGKRRTSKLKVSCTASDGSGEK